jgi:hypothetical protein
MESDQALLHGNRMAQNRHIPALDRIKISRLNNTGSRREEPVEYPNTFTRSILADGTERLVVGLRGGHKTVLPLMASVVAPPYRILYVLHTSPEGAPLGRYESPDIELPDVDSFCERFGEFLARDARHDVWLRSMPDRSTVVLDRYNLVYAYGSIDEFARYLQGGSIREVAEWAAPAVPYPHVLHYHPEFNDDERKVLGHFSWRHTPLAIDDVQYWSGPRR